MEIKLQVGSTMAQINGQTVTLPEAPVLSNGTMLAPVRALAQAMGLDVAWDGATQTATLTTPGHQQVAVAAQTVPDWHQVPDPTEKPWLIWEAPITSTPAGRSPDLLDAVIKQCGVAKAPRYQPNQQGAGETYCNIFLWDVTRALGCEIPHWISNADQKSPGRPGQNAYETDANAACTWLEQHGVEFGWTLTDAAGALTQANAGKPAVVVWQNPGGIGHVAVVRPGSDDPARGVPIAQAGVTNFDDRYLADGFGQSRVQLVSYYIHS